LRGAGAEYRQRVGWQGLVLCFILLALLANLRVPRFRSNDRTD
jgi:hypothetical protein